MMKARELIQRLQSCPNYEIMVSMEDTLFDNIEVVVDESLHIATLVIRTA